MKLSLKERLGLRLIQTGARLFFKHTKTGFVDKALEKKLVKLAEEVNAQTLLGCEIHAGGHGYDTPYAPVINEVVSVSIRDTLVNASSSLVLKKDSQEK